MNAKPSIAYTPLNNFRDLGGTPARHGVIRPGLLWRSDDPSTAPQDEIGDLVGRDLSTVVDLRGVVEVEMTGRGYLADHNNLALHSMSLDWSLIEGADPEGESLDDDLSPAVEMGRMYARLVAANAEVLVGIVEVVADAPGAVLIHCTAGKDRTGIAVAAVLSVLGVGDEHIVADYVRTQDAWPRIVERIAYVIRALTPQLRHDDLEPDVRPDHEPEKELIGADPETMQEFLTALRQQHGGFAELLRAAGLTPETERRLHDRLVEGPQE